MAESNNDQLDTEIKKALDKLDTDKYESLEKQCRAEYQLAWEHQNPKKKEWQVRLKLYNNQRRDKDAVGDTTLFATHQTVLASLYADRLAAQFGAREEGDEDKADNLDSMAKYDYDEMGKDEVDYEWDWDAGFFGRGILALVEYIRDAAKKIYVPVPEVYDPITFLRDPRATSINGNRLGRNGCRFYGRDIKMTKDAIRSNPNSFDVDFRTMKTGTGTISLLDDAARARAEAQGLQDNPSNEKNLGDNAEYDVTEWFTHWSIGSKVKKVRCWLANDRKKLIGFKELKNKYWPAIDRPLYPSSHDWDGTSIPDLVEDKQRARAVAQNLGLNVLKASLYPMYIYNSDLIKNRNDLNFNFNKFIPVPGAVNDAIAPLRKDQPNIQLLDFIYNTLDLSAQKATATSDIQQGMQTQKQRTLGETNLIQSNTNTRYSLSAKIFGWSERRFWEQWYKMYKDNFADNIDEKVLRLVGAFGAKWRPLRKDDFITTIDPDVTIESQVLSRAKQLEDRTILTEYFGIALAEPTSNRRWGLKKLARLNGLEKDEIERLFPPTIDERIAEEENDLLSDNKFAPVKTEDDHNAHLEVHNKAGDTIQSYAHIKTHEKALSIKKTNPEFFPADQQETAFQPPGTEPLPQPAGMGQPAQMGQPRPMGAAIAPSATSGQPAPERM